MSRFLLAGVLLAGTFVAPAAACELETCWFTSPVCTKVDCHVCYYEPPGIKRCIV